MDNFILQNAWIILICPLYIFIFNAFFCKKNKESAGQIGVSISFINLVFALLLAKAYYTKVLLDPETYPLRQFIPWEYLWLPFSEELNATIGILLDPISVMMMIVITTIAFLVNIYSIGYMKNDPSKTRFFSLLALFCFSMLGLVLSTNIIQMFVFWELVGASSYSLIGFWYHKPSAVAACKKAFLITRFADAIFLLGIIIVAFTSGSFDFLVLNDTTTANALKKEFIFCGFSLNLLTVSTIFIFAGGWGKSAMFPLHVWLPDAMEGPTPVSSIIHSATMVVAGVFLTARMFPLFAKSDFTLYLIAFVGAFTSLFAAVIACTQNDIKRILAFSTLSQLGYMIFSLGVSKMCGPDAGINILGYQASMFHIFTHAFFKCMLFLVAGSVIHAVHSNDIFKMGGLRKAMPFTYLATLIGCLALGGIWPLSGFWSKDEIILTAFQSHHEIIACVGLLTGGLTSFYMFRLFFVVFHGKSKFDSNMHPHEDKLMTLPIVILIIPSLISGLSMSTFLEYVKPAMVIEEIYLHHLSWLPYCASGIGAAGILLAFSFYGRGEYKAAESIKLSFNKIYTLISNKFYVDELYLFIVHKFIFKFFAAPIKWFDRTIVDGSINLCGELCSICGIVVNLFQNGRMQWYIALSIIGFYCVLHFGKLPF